jgi:hypothetical protein
MIVTYTEGGLGNVLFQIVFTLAKSRENNAEYYFANYEENIGLIAQRHNGDAFNYKNTIFKNIKIQSPPKNYLPIIQHHCPFEYSKVLYEPDCCNYYKGYFQTDLYQIGHEKYLSDIFKPHIDTETYLQDKYPFLFKLKCVAMHIRRGDYLQLSNFHPVLPIEYYHKALKQLPEFDKILVFTNDIDWCYENLIDSRIIFIEEKDWISMYMMSYCQYHVIANSSFSWWGARFAEIFNPEKDIKVICSNTWFGPGVNENTKDLIPDRWQKLI